MIFLCFCFTISYRRAYNNYDYDKNNSIQFYNYNKNNIILYNKNKVKNVVTSPLRKQYCGLVCLISYILGFPNMFNNALLYTLFIYKGKL